MFSNKNYFTPQIMDVWPEILGHLTDSKDVFSVMNSDPVLKSMLDKRNVAGLLLPLVLPVIMKNWSWRRKHLEPHDILNCRLVSKSVKAGVDDAIVEQQPVWVPENLHRFPYDGIWHGVRDLLDLPQDFTGNPFLLRRTELSLENSSGNWDPLDSANALGMLKRFGHELYDADLKVEFENRPYTRMRRLQRSLSYLPNIKKLSLDFEDHNDEDALKYNNLKNSRRPFPVLQHLEDLKIGYVESYGEALLPPPSSFVRPILLAYRKQITRLNCESFVFRGTNWRSFRFPQLRQLDVRFNSCEYHSETFRNVAKVDCPQLEKFVLDNIWGGLIITREMFEALDHFRNSLKELSLGKIVKGNLYLFQMEPASIREFPQMTTLRLDATDVGTEWMHLFRVMFPKLEEIHFKRLSWRYPSVEQSLEKIRNDYFTIFPNLKRIFWESGYGRQKPVVLTRQMTFASTSFQVQIALFFSYTILISFCVMLI